MAELIRKRWFQALGVIVMLAGFFVVMHFLRGKGGGTGEDKKYVAKVGDYYITPLEYQTAVSRRTMRIYYHDKMLRASDKENIHMSVFKELVNNKILDKLAAENHVTVTEADKDNRLLDLKSKIESDRKEMVFKVYLESMGYQTETELKEDLKYEILEQKLTEIRFPHKGFTVDEKSLRDEVPTIQLSQIFFPLNPQQLASQEINDSYKQLKERADTVYNQAMAGADFNDLAVKYSQDKHVAETRGMLGYVSKTAVSAKGGDPVFWQQADALEVGQISKPFQSRFGVHILKCTGRKGPGDPQYDEVLKGLRNVVIFRKQKAAFAAWFADELSTMEQNNKIEVYDHELLANKYRFAGDVEKSIAEYKKAIKEDPEYPYYYIDIAELMGRQGKKNEALTYFRKATEIAPMDGALYFRIGEVYMGYGEHDKALREFKRASDLSRLDYEIHLRLQNIYTQLGLLAEADDEHARYVKASELLKGGGKTAPPTAEEAVKKDDNMPAMPDFQATPESGNKMDLPLRPPGAR